MVVVESGSMMHDQDGSVGAIDPGDLVLVMDPSRVEIITYLEATKEGGEHEAHDAQGDDHHRDDPETYRKRVSSVDHGSCLVVADRARDLLGRRRYTRDFRGLLVTL